MPGIQVTNDPLMSARMFSYLDTQLSRLGGPNFTQLPINRPHAPVNDNLRDGAHQTAIHQGVTPYLPNGLDGGKPRPAGDGEGGFVTLPTPVVGEKVRETQVSFDDHFSQATMFWQSMSDVEKTHIVEAYTFELAKVYEKAVKLRVLDCLANIDADLCAQVAAGLGLPAPEGKPAADVVPSPALSQIVSTPGPIAGRVVGVIAGPGADLKGIAALRKALASKGAVLRVVSPVGGELKAGRRTEIVERTFVATRSVEYDAVVVAAGVPGLHDIKLSVLLQEAFRHCKAMGAWGDGAAVLEAAGIDPTAPGVLLADAADASFAKGLQAALGLHRAWERADLVTASAVAPA